MNIQDVPMMAAGVMPAAAGTIPEVCSLDVVVNSLIRIFQVVQILQFFGKLQDLFHAAV